MWTAKYKKIDIDGLRAEIKVTVIYSNSNNEIDYVYDVLPCDLDSDNFKSIIQNQLDILESKAIAIDESLINTRITAK